MIKLFSVKELNTMKLNCLTKRRTSFLILITGSVLLSSQFVNASKNKINYILLSGEWSKSGRCDQERFIYKEVGKKYVWQQKKNFKWKNVYQGIYIPKSESNSVIIGDGPNMDGYTIKIHQLSRSKYQGEWQPSLRDGLKFDNPEDAKFSFVKCQ